MRSTEEHLADLEKRLSTLENERGVIANMHRYAHSIDYGLEREWVDCFTEDGVFDIRMQPDFNRPGTRVDGRQALTAFIATHTRAPETWHKHMMVQPRISLNDGTARVESFFTRLDEDEMGEPYVLVFGRYKDNVQHCQDGRWRFKERIVEIEAIQQRPAPAAENR
ncbi:MAG: hypothetical protein CL897_06785 [Dehalococcoidia bacterium]|nr:hypothetical protein [Dehalococcoidia bacterium]HCV00388.1 hypothetical protein [Dehalococcoidia bacterium]|tara:strand:+ start:360 stop:857 length:498 start_codon:yes stop_codon:yes gene_type:complete